MGAHALVLGRLLQLGCQVHRVADDGVFEPAFITDRAEDDPARRDGRADAEFRFAAGDAGGVPVRHAAHQFVDRAQRIGGIGIGRQRRAEGHHDAVAHELVDGAAVLLQDGHDLALVIGQHGDHFVRLMGVRKIGEAANVAEQDGGFARLAGAGGNGLFRRGDLVGDFGRKEAGQILRRGPFGDRADQQCARPVDGHRDDRGHQQD